VPLVEKHGQDRFKDLDSALAWWLDFLDTYGAEKDWSERDRADHRAVAEAVYLLWGSGSSTGVLAAIRAGTGFRLWIGEWVEETRIAACWGFYGDLAKYYRWQPDSTDARKLAGVAATAAQSSANALERERQTQWDALFLEYGGLVLDDLLSILDWAGEKVPADPIDSLKIGAALFAVVGLAFLATR